MTSITVDHLTKRFDSVAALDDLSLEIRAGEMFFVLGPSGCGKTTLLKILAGFLKPSAGRVFFGSEEVSTLSPERRRCGMLFQNYALWPHLSVARNLSFGLEERRIAKREIASRVEEALSAVQLTGY